MEAEGLSGEPLSVVFYVGGFYVYDLVFRPTVSLQINTFSLEYEYPFGGGPTLPPSSRWEGF